MDRVKKIVEYYCEDTIKHQYLGKGVGVAILDTGLFPHPDLRGKVKGFKDYVNGRERCYDDCGHGTHVAGILAGDGRMSGGILSGMAPMVSLYIVKVLDEKGEGNIGAILEGLYWIEKNSTRLGIQIINLSVGASPGVTAGKEQMLIYAVERLWDLGLHVIVSAGNHGPKSGTVVAPGTSKKVITVGALRSNDRESMECSGAGPTEACVIKPDIVAPGYQILSCNIMKGRYSKPYTAKSGTSMATPVVSGAIALLLSKHPGMTNVEVKLRLRQSTIRIGESNQLGWGCISVKRLLLGT